MLKAPEPERRSAAKMCVWFGGRMLRWVGMWKVRPHITCGVVSNIMPLRLPSQNNAAGMVCGYAAGKASGVVVAAPKIAT